MIHYRLPKQQPLTWMKSMQSYQINQRALSMFSPLPDDLLLEENKNYLFDLSFMSLIAVKGEKAAEFLQGQLSCDLNQVTSNTMRQGLMCNLKGRILAMLDVFRYQDHLYLNLPDDMLESTLQSLAKTAMFSRVKLEKTTTLKCYGFYCQNPNDRLPEGFRLPENPFAVFETETYCAYHLGQGLSILCVKAESDGPIRKPFEAVNQYRSALAWQRLNLSMGRISIYPVSRGLFLPHRLDLQNKDYISFNKGCYKGQEIIARTHYKAKLKHQMHLYHIKTIAPLASGQKVFDESGQTEIAELIDFAPIDQENTLIALSILIHWSGDRVVFEGLEQQMIELKELES